MIVGLIKPGIILKWDKKPTRLKVFGYWVLSLVVIGVLGVITTDEEEVARTRIVAANSYIEKKEYDLAKSSLDLIKVENKYYSEAQELLAKVDSLIAISEEEERLAKLEEERLAAEEDKVKFKEQLERELKSIDEGINFSKYRGSIENIQIELVLFGTWAKNIKEGEESEDKEIQALAKKLKSRVIRIQAKEFPLMRKDYAKVVANKMWENDIDVSSSGSGHTRINFTGGIFAANKNKQDFQNQLHEILKMLRFQQARYRWYKGQNEYTYWDIKPAKDTDLVEF
ncbi:hypothetical protein [Phaeodactylibacter xiamenensis]|uniref:hypothetical protein n=1 Tax=Phaeodactylibacter xiamenensis TaxID=1524460 RepID=UPI0005C5F5A9|nr:hypothetical protein [Phaeodactylibacter xiamenensis]